MTQSSFYGGAPNYATDYPTQNDPPQTLGGNTAAKASFYPNGTDYEDANPVLAAGSASQAAASAAAALASQNAAQTSAANAASAVQSAAGTATPIVDGTAAVGTSPHWAHEDHVHPTDASRASVTYVDTQDATKAPLASPALTGTPTAPTAAVGTNTTQIATTAFVLANGVSGPGSATLGNLAVWNNTGGTALAAAPSFHGGNPANASVYSIIANPANGYTTTYNGYQFSQGASIGASLQFGANAVGVQQALVGTLTLASGDTGTQGNAVAGYAESNSTGQSAVGVAGYGWTNVTNGNFFGAAFQAQNLRTVVTGGGLDFNFGAAVELNPNFWQKAGGVNPTVGAGAYGLWIKGSGDVTGTFGNAAVGIGTASNANAKWANGFQTMAGAAATAFNAGPAATGNSQASQPVALTGTDAGGVARTATILADPNGALGLFPAGAGAVFTDHIQLTGMTTAGVVVNDGAGNLTTTKGPTLTAPLVMNAPNGAGAADIDASSRAVSIVAGGSAVVAGNNVGMLYVHEDTSSGQSILCLVGTFGGGFVTINAGANWSNTAAPTSGNFGIAYDGTNNVWRIYNGAGVTRSFQYFFLRIR